MPAPSRACRAVLFDLDGTLIDSLHDIGALMNEALIDIGLPPHPIDGYRRFVGSGLEVLVQRATAEYEIDLPKLTADYRARYRSRPIRHTKAFDGIDDVLDELRDIGLIIAVLSNKPHDLTVTITEELFGDRFARVYGHRSGFPRKPDPTAARELLNELDLDAASCVYVGDTDIDMQTADRSGMRPVGVAWGFRPEEELVAAGAETVLARPHDLLALVR